jgi:hypothetical protein
MLFISGEEIAWGQQFLHFKTPELLKAINTQNEFTFHNFGIFQDKSNYLNLIFGCMGMLGILFHVRGIMKKISVPTLFIPYICLILFLAAFGILFNHYLGERSLNYPSEYIFHIQTETAELLIALVGLLYPFVNRHIFFSPFQKAAVVDKIPNRKIPLLFPLPSYFARFTMIMGIVCLVWLAIIPGDEDKAFLFGLSQIRLAMLTVGLCILLFIIYITNRSGRDQEWRNSISTRLNHVFMKSTILWIFTVSGCMGFFACSISLIITYAHDDPYLTGILSRLAPWLVWTLILCLETIILTIPKLLPLARSRLLQVGDRINIEEM